MEKFEFQVLRFKSGVVAELSESKLLIKADNGSSSIESKNLDNFTYVHYVQPRLSIFGMVTRTFFGGLLLALIIDLMFVKNEWGAIFFDASAKDIFFGWLALIIAATSILLSIFIWVVFVFDMFLETGLYDRVILRFFADKGYYVTVGNRSGNNINFFAKDIDLPKVKLLEGFINLLKQFLDNKKQPHHHEPVETPITETSNTTTLATTQLDNLKKLGELYQSGILTKEEFDKKKTELLQQ